MIGETVRKFDWFIVVSSIFLSVSGLMTIFSSSFYLNDFLNFKKQLVFLLLSIAVMLVVSLIDWRVFRDGPHLVLVLYIISLAGLIGLLFFGIEIRGSRSWYNLGPISFNPIEFVKLSLIILLAKYFSTRHVEVYRIRHMLVSGVYVFIPALLILLQPEVGSIIILGLVWVGVLVISGIRVKHFLILCLCGLVLLAMSWSFLLQDYHKARIASFLSPSLEPLGIGWNQTQAKIAIGSGGLWGQGFGRGTQIRYGFLPSSQTDFIFAGLAEEWGLSGAGLVLLAFGILVWRMVKISLSSQSNFPRLFSAGLAIIIVAQVVINVGMNLGLLPIIGIPLPLVSYGGSSLLATFLGLGILQSMELSP